MSDLVDICRPTDYLWHVERYKTFSKWPFKNNARCLPISMADAGWYNTTEEAADPSAKCAFCLKELNGWERTDDPWDEHKKHSAECKFLKLGKKEKDCTVTDMHQLLEARMLKLVEEKYRKDLKKLEEMRVDILAKAEEKLPAQIN